MTLAALRLRARLTQHTLGDRLGVGAGVVSLWERGKHVPYQRRWAALRRVLRCTAAELEAALNHRHRDAPHKERSA
jgi:transcriptional regulator with XRE-family HTH domain